MNDYFAPDICLCRFCRQPFTTEEWMHLVPTWSATAGMTDILLHPACVKPAQVRERLLK